MVQVAWCEILVANNSQFGATRERLELRLPFLDQLADGQAVRRRVLHAGLGRPREEQCCRLTERSHRLIESAKSASVVPHSSELLSGGMGADVPAAGASRVRLRRMGGGDPLFARRSAKSWPLPSAQLSGAEGPGRGLQARAPRARACTDPSRNRRLSKPSGPDPSQPVPLGRPARSSTGAAACPPRNLEPPTAPHRTPSAKSLASAAS